MDRWKAWKERLRSEKDNKVVADQSEDTQIDLMADYVDGRDVLRDRIVSRLGKLVRRRQMAAEKALVIYIDDTYSYQQAVAYALANYMGTYIEANTDWQFKQVLVRLGKPEWNDVAVPVAAGFSMALRMPATARPDNAEVRYEAHRISYPATVKVLDGHGSMLEDQVVLMPIDGKVYNIGIGRVMVVGSSVRNNDIPVSDDEHSPMFRFNRYVSRQHARIVYRAGKGYYLFAEERGTPANGKRTEISRDSGVIRLDSPRTGQLLRDGDCIVLNRNVILTFTEKQDHP